MKGCGYQIGFSLRSALLVGTVSENEGKVVIK